MKIVIPGGSGHIGRILSRAFREQDHEVVVLSRNPAKNRANCRFVAWDGVTLGPWVSELEGADVVINLAGQSVNCRYTARNRKIITESRINSTRIIGEAISRVSQPPRVWLQASTATIYAHRFDAANDEATGIMGGSEPGAPETWQFSIDVATAWEKSFEAGQVMKTHKVLLRSAVVMSPQRGGAFNALLALVRYGLGGRMGDGRQYISWIHEVDFVRAISWLLENPLTGPVNLAAPEPLPNAEFMRILRKAWDIRFGLPAAEWMLEIGAFFLRTETELLLKSRRVVPARLLAAGFDFTFPNWSEAATDLCQRWRATS